MSDYISSLLSFSGRLVCNSLLGVLYSIPACIVICVGSFTISIVVIKVTVLTFVGIGIIHTFTSTDDAKLAQTYQEIIKYEFEKERVPVTSYYPRSHVETETFYNPSKFDYNTGTIKSGVDTRLVTRFH